MNAQNNTTTILAQKKPKLIPLTQWPSIHGWPPIGGLRHLVFNSKENGFDKVIRRVGRKVLIDEARFFEWVEEQNNKAAAGK